MVRPEGDERADSGLIADAVRALSDVTGFPLAFGGMTSGRSFRVTSVVGSRGTTLSGLEVEAGRGLGGQALAERRPRLATDYGSSRAITHDYDNEVLAEGIGTLLAVPVVVNGQTRCVLYGAMHLGGSLGSVRLTAAASLAAMLARELRDRDEIQARLAVCESELSLLRESVFASHEREALRETYAELRSIASGVSDETVRERLLVIQNQLVALGGPGPVQPASLIHLSPREVDVLSQIALGRTNAEIAVDLALTEATIKSYLGAAMSKLQSRTRHSAVARARSEGLIL